MTLQEFEIQHTDYVLAHRESVLGGQQGDMAANIVIVDDVIFLNGAIIQDVIVM